MRATIDIPDELYKRVKVKAAQSSQTVRQLVLKGIDRVVEDEAAEALPRRSGRMLESNAKSNAAKALDPAPIAPETLTSGYVPVCVEKLDARSGTRFEIPTIPSDRPGTLDLTNEQIYDLIGFP
jgi:hypothetical protein